MKARRFLFLMAAILLLMAALGGCGGSAKTEAAAPQAAADMSGYRFEDAAEEEMVVMEAPAEAGGGIANSSSQSTQGTPSLSAEKIIYSASAEVETTDYDGTVAAVYEMVERFGGFVQSSSISGSDYYSSSRGYRDFRRASFTLRIPSENFDALTGSLSQLGNVPYCNTNSQNVTAQYYDVQSRINAYRIQEARLLEMLEIAETVEDMLAIQQQLTEVQYELDSCQSTLTNYDRRIQYSTVELSVREVEKYTEQPVVVLGYWEKMAKGFGESLQDVAEFFQELLLWLVGNLPMIVLVLVLIALAVRILIGLLRRARGEHKTRAERRAERTAKKEARRAAKTVTTSGDTPAISEEEKSEE